VQVRDLGVSLNRALPRAICPQRGHNTLKARVLVRVCVCVCGGVKARDLGVMVY